MRALLTLLALLLPLSASAQLESVASLNRGLVGRWDFSSGTGTNAYDISGQTNTGTLSATGCTWTNGVFDGGLSITNGYCTNSFRIPTGDSSFSVWLKPVTVNVYQAIISNNAGVAWSNVFELFIDNTANRFFGYCFNYGPRSGTNTCISGQWVHIAGVSSNNVANLYINGKISGTAGTNVYPSPIAGFLIGGRPGLAGYNLKGGLIDDVRIYNRALSSNEVYNLFSQGCVRAGLTP